MTNYVVKQNNTYNTTDSPIVFEMGFYNQKTLNYKCITKINDDDIIINENIGKITLIANNKLLASNNMSYSIILYDKNNPISLTPYNFYLYSNLHINNEIGLLQILNSELPNIYNPLEPLNNADNTASVAVMEAVYSYVYELYYNSISSIGVKDQYNSAWELVYVGVNNFLTGAKYPAELLKTLMRIKSQTGTRRHDIAILISRVLYQYTGGISPVEILFNSTSQQWEISIYNARLTDSWALGTSQLGIDTILGKRGVTSWLFWFISALIQRLMPVSAKWIIYNYEYTNFIMRYNTDIVDNNDFYNPDVLYPCYAVINNKEGFNTQGYIVKEEINNE